MTTKLITLKTTQTLMADIDCTDENQVILKNPVQVIVQPGKDGSPMMGFAPFLEFADEFKTGIKITMDNVLCITTPVRELENQYSKMFGVGIQIASSIPNV
jgi:hypothetical protein